jgi:sensor histidine kinase YesM
MLVYYLINTIIFILCYVAYKKDDILNCNISLIEIIYGLELYEFIYYILIYYDSLVLEEITNNKYKKL